SKGLIGLSGCLKGEVAEYLMDGNYAAAKKSAGQFSEIFGQNNFFLEIQDQDLEQEKKINPSLLKLSSELGLPLVATNDRPSSDESLSRLGLIFFSCSRSWSWISRKKLF